MRRTQLAAVKLYYTSGARTRCYARVHSARELQLSINGVVKRAGNTMIALPLGALNSFHP